MMPYFFNGFDRGSHWGNEEPALIAYPVDANGSPVETLEKCATCPQSEHPFVPAHGYCYDCMCKAMDAPE